MFINQRFKIDVFRYFLNKVPKIHSRLNITLKSNNFYIPYVCIIYHRIYEKLLYS